ncbi:MAG: NADH-quinone oxidoreductase subunit H [Fimbriimonas ginsengisoli]|uniref:NADH-quinone oxidoreductase subunit H n=1 Tax=Fimbriimonas ginsengisoli TaxID=1005039 RepID=A0A931PU02_FIMGI|nr:NADH-quinone oxidoreductase subunit H [Fimbriimonas ginsengisoli]
MSEWINTLHPAWQALIRVLLVVLPILMLVPGMIWWERRLLSWMQDRIGPNRVATITWSKTSRLVPGFLRGKKTHFFGLIQPIADGVKLFLKEDITPAAVDRVVYFIAPAVALFPAFALGGTLPWGPFPALTPIADVNIGVLYVLAVSSLGVYGVVLGGYASDNKYSLMGGLRSSAQLISYELAMGMSLAGVVMATGSLKITEMVKAQEAPLWGAVPTLQNWFIFTPFGFISAVVFLVCMVAETNRAPFDLPEAENELIAGYHTEYSSMKFAVFFMGEYAAMFVFSGVFAAVFLGGYNLLPIRWDETATAVPAMAGLFKFLGQMNGALAGFWFLGKCALGITAYIWLRATLPRLRYDQLMSLGWRSLLPLAVSNLIVVALWIVCTEVYGASAAWIAVVAAGIALSVAAGVAHRIAQRGRPNLEVRGVRLVGGNPAQDEAVVGGPAA